MDAPQPRLWLNPPLFAVLSRNAMEVRPEGADTILIVDDDELVRKSAATLIARLGYRVLSAASGPEALEILRQDTSIDLLFTDIFMPGGLHGPQLVTAARRLRPELKILFTSGYFEHAEVRHALDPAIEQVSKPYEPEVLATILRRTLSGRGSLADHRRSDGEERASHVLGVARGASDAERSSPASHLRSMRPNHDQYSPSVHRPP